MAESLPREESGHLDLGRGQSIAFRRIAAPSENSRQPGVIFLGGLASNMTGSKASALAAHAQARGFAFLRFDYSGHGQSTGDFAAGRIGDWRREALAVFDRLTTGPQIVVGSSLGGWLMLHLAQARPQRIRALIGIAAAPDFTEDLIWDRLNAAERAAFAREGKIDIAAPGSPPLYLSRDFVVEARAHLLLRAPLALDIPMRLFQGLADREVPAATALRLAEIYTGADCRLTFIKDGDHRLSRPQDIALILAGLEEFMLPQ